MPVAKEPVEHRGLQMVGHGMVAESLGWRGAAATRHLFLEEGPPIAAPPIGLVIMASPPKRFLGFGLRRCLLLLPLA